MDTISHQPLDLVSLRHSGTTFADIFLVLLFVSTSDETVPGEMRDYCEDDYFEVQCPPGKIIFMEEARYGRMELGSCISTDFGYLNCYSNVLAVMDQWCSGRTGCNVYIANLIAFRKSCTRELPGYLQARYTCETAVVPDRQCCQASSENVILAENRGLISNYMTESSGCGGTECPWILKASHGQRFNISLYDFGTHLRTDADVMRGSPDRRCNIYANIREEASGARVTVCAGETRYRHLYTTVSSSVEIQIVNTGNDGDDTAHFVIAFAAFGCLNPNPPADGLANRQGDRALITCKYSNVQWELTCEDGEWLGHFGICAKNGTNTIEGGGNPYLTREVYMVLVIAIAFVLAVAIVTTGIVCLYRHWSQIPSAQRGFPSQLTHMHPQDGTYLASEFDYSLPRQRKGYDTVGYKHYNPHRNVQEDPRLFTNIGPDRENDKGYYSDRTYESPIVNTGSGTLTCSRSNTPFNPNDHSAGFTS